MQKIKISKMTAKDLPQIYEIENEAFPIPWEKETFEHELSNLFATYLIAKVDDTVVGFIGAWFIMDECQITNLAVHKNYRKSGVASQLVAKLFNECKDRKSVV